MKKMISLENLPFIMIIKNKLKNKLHLIHPKFRVRQRYRIRDTITTIGGSLLRVPTRQRAKEVILNFLTDLRDK